MPSNERVLSTLPSLRVLAGTALGVGAANAGAAPAWAQAPADTSTTNLPTLSVTGSGSSQGGGYQVTLPQLQKLTAPLVDTPQSVIEIPRQLLDDEGVTTMRDALRNAPGVSLAAGEGAQQGDNLSIRGFNAQNDFYLDGMLDFGSYYRDPFNLQDIEVLEGPSSMLFGRGSTGGVVNQVSKLPTLAPITQGSIVLGTDGTRRVTVDMNRQVTASPIPGTAIRLNVMGDLNGTAGRPDAENRRFGFAPEIAFGLGTPTRVYVNYYHLQAYDTPDYGIPWLNGKPAPVSQENFYGYKDSDFFRTNVDIGTVRAEHDFADWFSLSAQSRYASYERALRVTEPQITGFQPKGITAIDVVTPGVPLSALTISRNLLAETSRETTFDNQVNGNLTFHTGELFKHNVVFGLEVARQTSDPTRITYPTTTALLLSPQSDTPFTGRAAIRSISGYVGNDYAGYAVDTLSIGRYVDLMGGFRWDRFDSSFHQYATSPTLNISRDDDLPSWNGAIVVKPTEYGSVYFHYGTSFDPSAEADTLSAATAGVAPEKTAIYEVGTKWDLLNRKLSLTGSFFRETMANVRETDPNNALQDVLAGNYRMRGFQLGVTGNITGAWEMFVGYVYNDGLVVSSPNPLERGHTPPNTPHHTFAIFTEYHLPWQLIPGRTTEIGGGVNYVSQRTASSTPVAGTNFIETAPGYATLSLMAKQEITREVSAQVNISNATNTYYYDGLHPSHIIVGAQRAALFTINVKL